MTRELTFACLQALEPRVIKLVVIGTSTVIEPSPAASTTAASTGLKGAAVGANRRWLCVNRGRCHRGLGGDRNCWQEGH